MTIVQCVCIFHCVPLTLYIPLTQLQTIHEGGAGDDSKDANSDSEGGAGDDSEDVNSDSEGGSSEVEGEDDVPLKSIDNVITIYVDDSSNDVATQTDPSELGLCDLVIQRLDKVLAIELISSEMGVTMYIL